MALSDELIAIKLELKGQREAISGLKSVDKAQHGLGTSTTRAGTAAAGAEKKTSRLSRAYASLGKAAKWGLGIIGVSGILALKSAIDNTEELSKTTAGLTRNFGLHTNVASRWATLVHSRGIDSKALSTTIGVLSSKMVEAARKGGTALTPWHQLKISQQELVEHSNDAGWALMRVTKALGEEEGGAKRAAAAKGVLGKGWLTLAPLMAEGTKGLKEQLRWADRYGSLLDTKTNDSIMGMVMAQRENKAAMFGLQVQVAKHLAPAFVSASEDFQDFVAILNSDKLTSDQKIHRIEQQFLGLEDTLIQIVSDALPKVAERGGELGVKLAGAVWTGFKHSGLAGKLVITYWLMSFMGGGGLIRRVAGGAGKAIAWGLLKTLMPTLAAELAVAGSVGSLLATKFATLGTMAGTAFGAAMSVAALAALALEVKYAIDHREELFGLDLLFTPKTDSTSIEEEAQKLEGMGYTGISFDSGHKLEAVDPRGRHVTETSKGGRWVEHIVGGRGGASGRGARSQRQPRIETPKLPRIEMSGLRPIHHHHHHHHKIVVELDGKVVAESTADHAIAAAALS